MDKLKKIKTYSYDLDVIQHADTNPMISSFSEWACERYKQEFMNIESLATKMDVYLNMANTCKDKIKELKNDQITGLNKGILNNRELDWLKYEAPNRIKKSTFEGVYKAFCRTFDRYDLNRKQFRLLIAKYQ